MQDANPVFNLKVPEAQKTKEWYKAYVDYIVPYDSSVTQDYHKMRLAYAFINDDLTPIKDDLIRMCNPLSEVFGLDGPSEDFVTAYNNIFSKCNYHLGQMRNYGLDLDVVPLSSEVIKNKQEEFRAEIKRMINEEILVEFAKQESMEQGSSQAEADVLSQKQRTGDSLEEMNFDSYTSNVEQFYVNVKDYFLSKFNIDDLIALTMKHVLATDRCFVDIEDGPDGPYPVVDNPLHCGFHKSPDLINTQEGDYTWKRIPISVKQVYEELHDKLPLDRIKAIISSAGSSGTRPNKKWDVKGGTAQADLNYTNVEMIYESNATNNSRHIGQGMANGNSSRRHSVGDYVWKTIIRFIAFKEVVFYTYIDEYGKPVTDVLPANYPIPKDAAKRKVTNRYGIEVMRKEWIDDFGNPVYAERLWIPRRYEVKRYGAEELVDYRECPNQPLDINNPFNLDHSQKGRIFSSVNAESISLVERAMKPALQYIFVRNLENRELAKYEGFIKNIDASQIPDYLALDEDGNPIADGVDKLQIWRWYRKKLGDSYYDSTQSPTGLPNHTRSTPVKPEVAGSIAEILNMEQLADLLDRRTGMTMLVPPQAEGIYAPYSNTSDNQQALQQGAIMAHEYYSTLALVWKYVVNEYLIRFKNYYQRFFAENPDETEVYLNYMNSKGQRAALRITPEILQHEGMGIFIKESKAANVYRQTMMNQIFALTQAGGEGAEMISSIILALARGESPQEIHKKIVLAAKVTSQQQQELEKLREQAAMAREQALQGREERKHTQKMEQIDNTKSHDKELKAMEIAAGADEDGIPSAVEIHKIMEDLRIKEKAVDKKSN